MKRYKNLSIAALGMLILALSFACTGSGTPVPIGDIPVYPGATSMNAADDLMASALLEGMEEAAAEDADVDADFDVYALPSGTTWKDVKDFYISEIKGTDWEPADDLTTDEDVFHMIGWERSAQALGVGYVPEEYSDSPLLLIMLATEN